MRQPALALTTALFLTGALAPAHAQVQKLRPGLWEHSVVMKSQSGQMEAAMTFNGPTAYTGQFKVTTTTNGKPDQLDMAQTGKWLAADCGALKPAR